jgi:hypothetical protein
VTTKPLGLLMAFIAMMGNAMTSARAQDDCGMSGSFHDPHPVMHDGSNSMFWVRPLEVDADGVRNAYHRDDPLGNKGLAIEYLGNGMTIIRDGKPLQFNVKEDDNVEWLNAFQAVVKNGWKAPSGWEVDVYGFAMDENGGVCVKRDGRLVSATSLVQRPDARYCDPDRYVDALKLPGIVVPNRADQEKPVKGADPEIAPPFAKRGVSRGDLAIVYNPETQIWKGAFIYDTGPRDLLGEGSLRLVLDLRAQNAIPTSALETNALGIDETNVLLFPGTAHRLGTGRTWTQQKIETLATEQFKSWGGGTIPAALEKLHACAESYKARYH